jgi:hypothetical protein
LNCDKIERGVYCFLHKKIKEKEEEEMRKGDREVDF